MRYAHTIHGKTYYTLENEYKSIEEYKEHIKWAYGSLHKVKVFAVSDEEYNKVKLQRRLLGV